MATLTAKNLAKAYKGRRVVEDVSLTVNSGEIVGLLGPNGAGKTTTFYMVVGIVPRDAGNIIIDDDDISLLPLHARARRGIGYLPQEASIFRRLSVYDNLMAVLQIRDDLSAEQREDRANELMEEFHIEHLRDSMGQSLSGGERRRVEIARALAANPKFILLDEPFAGVDPISVIDIKRIIEHLRDSLGQALSGGERRRVEIARALAANPQLLLLDEPFGALDAFTRDQMQTLLLKLWQETGKQVLLITHDIEEAVFMATELVLLSSGPGRVLERLPLNFARRFVAGESSRSIKSDPQFIAMREYVLSRVFEQREAFS